MKNANTIILLLLTLAGDLVKARKLRKHKPKPPAPCNADVDDVDVFIAGLGWAGIAAMYELQRFNNASESLGIQSKTCISFSGVDGFDNYGGRINFGELVSGGDKNPIAELIFRLFSQEPNSPDYLLYTEQKWQDIFFYDLVNQQEFPAPIQNSARNNWNDAYECLQTQANQAYLDYISSGFGNIVTSSMQSILDSPACSWNPTPLEKNFEWYEVNWEFLLDPDQMAGFGNVPLWTYYLMQDKDYFVTSPRNLGDVAAKTVEAYVPNYPDRAVLDTKITEIDWTSDPVVVRTDNAAAGLSGDFTAENVLVTFSVGALAEHASTLFVPYDASLDSTIQALTNTYFVDGSNVMGVYKLLFVQFSESAFAQANLPNTEFIFTIPGSTAEIGKCTMWQQFDRGQKEFFDGSRAFACTLLTDTYYQLVDLNGVLPDTTAQTLIDNLLHAIDLNINCVRATGSIDFFPPIDWVASGIPSWADCAYQIFDGAPNDLFRGSWSTLIPGWSFTEYNTTVEPIFRGADPVIYFAGEAICLRWTGFQHGAWNSGRTQVRKIINSYLTDTEKELWRQYSDADFPEPPVCELPTFTPPVRKSKTIP